ncbi:MAG TPA: nuclear transport factor 2 family protein [Flavobacteriales bacterium]|nr:nuclear transport factor 2 family protein [Flavobacteriales bacterium]
MTAALTNPTVKAAIDALNAHDQKAWEALFAPKATFSDDGNEGSLANFTANAFGKGQEHFTSIDKVEGGGLHVYGRFHSDTWGDFKTYFKFTVSDGRITRLEVGQANY